MIPPKRVDARRVVAKKYSANLFQRSTLQENNRRELTQDTLNRPTTYNLRAAWQTAKGSNGDASLRSPMRAVHFMHIVKGTFVIVAELILQRKLV